MADGFISFAPGLAATNEGFHQEYFAGLKRVEDTNFWFVARNQLIAWAMSSYFPEARSMLEIGCGTGFVLLGMRKTFPHLSLTGSEIFTSGLQHAKKRIPGVQLYQMDARYIPFEREFDVIGSFDVLEHIDEDNVVLQQMFQTCKQGGGIVLTVPQHMWMWSALDEYSFHKRRYSREELIEKVEAAGFTTIRSTSFVSLLLPIMWLSRRRMGKIDAPIDLLAQFQISNATQLILQKIMNTERWLIRSGFSFPAGGSLLVVARK